MIINQAGRCWGTRIPGNTGIDLDTRLELLAVGTVDSKGDGGGKVCRRGNGRRITPGSLGLSLRLRETRMRLSGGKRE